MIRSTAHIQTRQVATSKIKHLSQVLKLLQPPLVAIRSPPILTVHGPKSPCFRTCSLRLNPSSINRAMWRMTIVDQVKPARRSNQQILSSTISDKISSCLTAEATRGSLWDWTKRRQLEHTIYRCGCPSCLTCLSMNQRNVSRKSSSGWNWGSRSDCKLSWIGIPSRRVQWYLTCSWNRKRRITRARPNSKLGTKDREIRWTTFLTPFLRELSGARKTGMQPAQARVVYSCQVQEHLAV